MQEGIFAPTYDLQGNVLSLIDSYYSEKIESYEYNVFGKEIIFDGNGEQLLDSSVNNPWIFANKRKDKTTGLINFGLRDYDPNRRGLDFSRYNILSSIIIVELYAIVRAFL